MNKSGNSSRRTARFCSLLLWTILIAASAHAQTSATGSKDDQSNASNRSVLIPRLELPLRPVRFSLMPTTASRTSADSRFKTIHLSPTVSGPNLQVLGSGTSGRLTKWTGITSSNSSIGDSTIFEDKFGHVGIGTDSPASTLTVQGLIETTLGGYKFPDGTVQSTAAVSGLSSIAHTATLTGAGTSALPLSVAIPLNLAGSDSFALVQITNQADAGSGAVVTAGSGTLSGGLGVLAQGGGGQTGGTGVRARGGAGSVNGGIGALVEGGEGAVSGEGIRAVGGASFVVGGLGGLGLDATGGNSLQGVPGDGVNALGGNTGLGFGGVGVHATGGNSNEEVGGSGVRAEGGASGSAFGGDGVRAVGGLGSGSGNRGGDGIFAQGGQGQEGAGQGLAGEFNGRVEINGFLSKSSGSFKIDHPLDPENKYLYHSFVESPDMKNIYDGMAKLDSSGEATVQLPEWFGALNKDFRYLLTAIGAPSPTLYIAEEITENRFRIAGGTPGMKVSWQVTGIRQDAYANAHRIKVEEDKPERERGSYLHPDVMGQPEERGVEWARHPELMLRLKETRLKQIEELKPKAENKVR